MKLHKRILSLALTLSTLVLCFTIFSVMASDIDDSNYTYVVDNMTFYKGDKQIDSLYGATRVAVDFTRRVAGEESDEIIMSLYSETGELLEMYSSSHYINLGKTCTFSVSLNVPDGKSIGEVKAYVWKSFADMAPLSNALSTKIEKVELDATLLNAVACTTSALEFYNDESKNQTTKYNLTADAGVYVNGFKASGTFADTLSTYVTSLKIGKITLVNSCGTDSEYNEIHVDAYKRDMIVATSDNKIIMTSTALNLDKEVNEDLEYHIYYKGKKITIAELQKDDVLSIAYDVNFAVEASDYYEIYVSRNTVAGTLTGKPDMIATIDGIDYDFVTENEYLAFNANIGDQIILYLDYFGDIYDWEIDTSAINWGIAERFTLSSSDDEYKLTTFTADGTKKAYYFDAQKGVVKVNGVRVEGDQQEALKALVYASGSTKNFIEDRVIQYKISSSSGKITEVNFISAEAGNGDAPTAYDATINRIGAIRLSDSTKIIDACEYESEGILSSATNDALFDDASYVAYAYGDKIDNAHQFVLITQGPTPYTSETRFAVVTEEAIPTSLGDEVFYEIEALYGENDVVTLIATDEDETDIETLKAGDVIFFKTNGAGYIKDVDVIFSFDNGLPTYTDLSSMSLVNDNEDNNVSGITITSAGANFGTGVFTQDWDAAIKVNDTVKLVYGPIAEVSKNSISFAKIVNGETDLTTDVQEYDIAPEINVYKYDFGSTAKFKFDATTKTTGAAIQPSRFLTKLIQENDDVIDWDDATAKHNEKANFAFALVVEDEVVEIFEFIAG